MKFLLTVGTGRFDEMVLHFDSKFDERLLIQYGTGNAPKLNRGVKFISDLNNRYGEFQMVITHAGAGTIYRLLELSVPVCLVPNVTRQDKHQLEIANYVKRHELGLVYDMENDHLNYDEIYERTTRISRNCDYPGPTFDTAAFINHFLGV